MGKKRILIVDNDVDTVELYSNIVLDIDLDPYGAHDLHGAIESYERDSPHIILTDFRYLPETQKDHPSYNVETGRMLAMRVRGNCGLHLPIMCLTGREREPEEVKFFNAYLIKPVIDDYMCLILTNALTGEYDNIRGVLIRKRMQIPSSVI
ncbi:MAG: response regulator [Candidatus Aenigmatarchaeota archaeon]